MDSKLQLTFYKYHGTGNDFIMIDNRDGKVAFTSAKQVAQLCDRRFGIGADGLILIAPSDDHDFKMVYYNADGNEGSMCGNGGRCSVAFASFIGIVKERATFEAVDGLHEAKLLTNATGLTTIALRMNDVENVHTDNHRYEMNTGSPHLVLFTQALYDLDVYHEGKKIRYGSPYTEAGINVNFVEKKEGKIFMRTYERGVEDETWSCGTGTVAVAIAAVLEGLADERQEVHIESKGGPLSVQFKRDGNRFSNIILTGPAKQVFQGNLSIINEI